jgi:hypothetical protein
MGSVIPDLIRDRHDKYKLNTFLNYDAVSLRMVVDPESRLHFTGCLENNQCVGSLYTVALIKYN